MCINLHLYNVSHHSLKKKNDFKYDLYSNRNGKQVNVITNFIIKEDEFIHLQLNSE